MKKLLVVLFVAFLISAVSADSISSTSISTFVRLGEKVTVSGNYVNPDANAFTLCKFLVSDANGVFVDRWTDEYTFSDGSFYAEKVAVEPPYYRGDNFIVEVTCGTASASSDFNVLQPLGLAHPVQMGWDFAFDQSNLEAGMLLITFLGLLIIPTLAVAFLIKRGHAYAG